MKKITPEKLSIKERIATSYNTFDKWDVVIVEVETARTYEWIQQANVDKSCGQRNHHRVVGLPNVSSFLWCGYGVFAYIYEAFYGCSMYRTMFERVFATFTASFSTGTLNNLLHFFCQITP